MGWFECLCDVMLFIFGPILTVYDWLVTKPFDVQNEVVVITGSAGGIGSRMAVEFAKHGAKLVLIDRNQDSNKNLEEELKVHQVKVKSFACDVSIPGELRAIAQQVCDDAELGIPRVVICNAAVLTGEFFMDHTEDQTIRAFLPHMLTIGRGNVALMGSASSFTGHQHLSAYSASKFAIRGLAESLHVELLERYNGCIKITCVHPWFVQTALLPKKYAGLIPPVKAENVATSAVTAILESKREIFVRKFDWVIWILLKAILPFRSLDAAGRIYRVNCL